MTGLKVLANVCITALFFFALALSSGAQTFTTVFDFDNTNGAEPNFLVQGDDGNLHGTTTAGGVRKAGTVFQLTPDGKLTTLYSFCSRKNCTDGYEPLSLVQTSDGSWFGLTSTGGFKSSSCAFGCGTLFQLTPSGALRVLHSFCSQTNCTDGASPTPQLIQAADGKFYGTTKFGGAYNQGTIYSLTSSGNFTVLYNFCYPTNCSGGQLPWVGLIQANNGVLYGTTAFGGTMGGGGTIYRITTNGNFSSLYGFTNGEEAAPDALIQGADGNLYGTSLSVGTGGTVFKFSAGGTYTTLHTFCLQSGCPDGYGPYGGLTQGSDGGLYGITPNGGSGSGGTIFEITRTGTFVLPHSFCAGGGSCPDGYVPLALIQGTNGLFYGVTQSGGIGYGTVYSLSMGLGPFVKATSTFGRVGMTIGVLGNNLIGTTSVTFNGTSASFTVVSDTYITASVPTGATTGTIEVITSSGTLSSNVPFRVLP